jgi:hypothetical protein
MTYFFIERSLILFMIPASRIFWKKKGDNSSKEGPEPGNDDMDASGRNSSSSTARMDIDKPQSSSSSSHGKTVSDGSKGGSVGGPVGNIAVTPFNPNPMTPRGKEIVAEARLKSLELIAKSFREPSVPLAQDVSAAVGAVVIHETSPCMELLASHAACTMHADARVESALEHPSPGASPSSAGPSVVRPDS